MNNMLPALAARETNDNPPYSGLSFAPRAGYYRREGKKNFAKAYR
jgi:hypothetical protein